MFDRRNEYTYPAYFKRSYGETIITFPDFPEFVITSSNSRSSCFFNARHALQGHAEKLLHLGYILPHSSYSAGEDSNLGELVFITIYCEQPGFWWHKPFLDHCIIYTIFSVTFLFLLGSSLSVFSVLGWFLTMLIML